MSVDNHDKEIALSKQTLTQLQELHIPPSPKCYEVMYIFLKGDNMEVTNAIEKFLKKNDKITEALLLKLHTSVLSYDTIARTINIVTNLLTTQINALTDSVSTGDHELNVFSEAIDSFNHHVTGDETPGKNIMDYITQATSRIKDKVKDLNTDLNKSQDEIFKLQSYLDNVCQESMIDPLTALATRKKSDQILSKSIRDSLETGEKLSIILMEIDYYEEFNAKWGPVTSEQILRFVALSLKENMKGRDTAARFSTSLFLLILPKTDDNGALTLAEYIRNTIERKRIIKKTTGEFLGRITVSSGIAEFEAGESIGSLMNRVEKILDVSRQNGHNVSSTLKDLKDITLTSLPKAS